MIPFIKKWAKCVYHWCRTNPLLVIIIFMCIFNFALLIRIPVADSEIANYPDMIDDLQVKLEALRIETADKKKFVERNKTRIAKI